MSRQSDGLSEDGLALMAWVAFLDLVARESAQQARLLPRGWHRSATRMRDFAAQSLEAIHQAVQDQRDDPTNHT